MGNNAEDESTEFHVVFYSPVSNSEMCSVLFRALMTRTLPAQDTTYQRCTFFIASTTDFVFSYLRWRSENAVSTDCKSSNAYNVASTNNNTQKLNISSCQLLKTANNRAYTLNKLADLFQGGHYPVIIKFPDFSRHFKWIFMEYRPSQQ